MKNRCDEPIRHEQGHETIHNKTSANSIPNSTTRKQMPTKYNQKTNAEAKVFVKRKQTK